MLEVVVPIGVALATGFSVIMNRLHTRVFELDRRIDNFELKVAENSVTKLEFSVALDKMEAHMIRIEGKLDDLISK